MNILSILGKVLLLIAISINLNAIENKKEQFILSFTLNKHKVYQGEAILATLKFSYKLNTNPLDINLEEFTPKHFWVKKLKNPKSKVKKDYITQTSYYLIFPEMVGVQTIESQIMNIAIREPKTNFMIWKKIISNKETIEVLPLPKNINVQGSYSIHATIDKNSTTINKPINLTIKIKGFGNIDDIEPFKFNLKDEVVYSSNPEIKSIIDKGKYGGEFTQKIAIIANKDFIIPQIKFNYFDIKTKTIKTIKTKSFHMKVKNGYKNTPKIQTKTIVVKKENNVIKYIYALFGFILGFAVYYFLFKYKRSNKKDDKPIIKKIKQAKNDKELYHLLLPYCQDEKIKVIISYLEKNIYFNAKNKINKKELILFFEEFYIKG